MLGVSRDIVKKVQQDNNIPSKATPEGRAAFTTWSAQRIAKIAADAAAKVAKAQQTTAAPVVETPANVDPAIKAAEDAKLKADADAKAVEDARLKADADAKAVEDARLKAETDAKLKAEQEKASAATTGTVGTGTGAEGAGASIRTKAPARAATDVASGVGVGGVGPIVSESNVGTEGKQPTLITEEERKKIVAEAREAVRKEAVAKAKIAVTKQKPLDIAEEEKLANEAIKKPALGLTEKESKKRLTLDNIARASKEKQIEDAAEIIYSAKNKPKITSQQKESKTSALKYLVDVKDGITSTSEVVEKEAAAANLETNTL